VYLAFLVVDQHDEVGVLREHAVLIPTLYKALKMAGITSLCGLEVAGTAVDRIHMDLMRFDGIVCNLSVAIEAVGLDGIRSVHGLLYPTVPMYVVRSVTVHAFQPGFPVHAVTIDSGLVALEASLLRYLIVSRIDVAILATGSIARLLDRCSIGVGLGMTVLAR
jgi:hypothetical protein